MKGGLCNINNLNELLTSAELLKQNGDNGTIYPVDIEHLCIAQERSSILKKHTNKIWQSGGYYCTYVADPSATKGRRIKRSRSKEGLEEAIIQIYKENETNPTIDEVFKEWNDKKLENRSIIEATHLRNQYCYERHFAEFGKRKIKSVRPLEFQDFLESQVRIHEMKARGFSNLKGIVRGFLKRAKKKGYITFNVEEMLGDMDITDRQFVRSHRSDEEEIFYDDEISRIIEVIRENPYPNNLAVALMFATGMRIGEVVTLKHSDFNGMTVTIRRSETRYRLPNKKYEYVVQDHPKTDAGFRTIVIPDSFKWVVDKLKTSNPFGEWIFVRRDRKTKITTNTIRSRIRSLCKELDIPIRSSHKIRKTYGSILLDSNLDTKFIQSQMGHTDIQVTETFYHRDRRKIDQNSRIINSVEAFKNVATPQYANV